MQAYTPHRASSRPSITNLTIRSLLHSSFLTSLHHLIIDSMHLFVFSVFVSVSVSNSLSTSSKTYCFSAFASFYVSLCFVCFGFRSLVFSVTPLLHLFYHPLCSLHIRKVFLTYLSFALDCHFYLFFIINFSACCMLNSLGRFPQ